MSRFLNNLGATFALATVLALAGCGGSGGNAAVPRDGRPAGSPPTGIWNYDELVTKVAGGPIQMTLRIGRGFERRDFDVSFDTTRIGENDAQLGLFKSLNGLGAGPGTSGGALIYQGKLAFGVSNGYDQRNFEGTAASQAWAEADEFNSGRAPERLNPALPRRPIELFVPSSTIRAGEQWLTCAGKSGEVILRAQPQGEPPRGLSVNSRGGDPGFVDGVTYTGHWSNNVFFLAHMAMRYDRSGLVLATFHGITGRGASKLPIKRAYGFQLEDGSYWGYPADDFFGVQVYDGRYCTLIREGATPDVTNATAALTQNGNTETRRHFVANDFGSYNEGFANFVELYYSTGNLFRDRHDVAGTATVRWTAQVEGGEVQVFEETLDSPDLLFACQGWVSMTTFQFFSENQGLHLTRSELNIVLGNE